MQPIKIANSGSDTLKVAANQRLTDKILPRKRVGLVKQQPQAASSAAA
jgi:hypothetical protein